MKTITLLLNKISLFLFPLFLAKLRIIIEKPKIFVLVKLTIVDNCLLYKYTVNKINIWWRLASERAPLMSR